MSEIEKIKVSWIQRYEFWQKYNGKYIVWLMWTTKGDTTLYTVSKDTFINNWVNNK